MMDAKLVTYHGNGGVSNPALVLGRNEDNDECDLVVLGVRSDGGSIEANQIHHFSSVPKGGENQGHTWS